MARIKKAKAIERLQTLLNEAPEPDSDDDRSPRFQKWTEDVYSAFFHIFGEDSRHCSRLPGGFTRTPNGIRDYLNSMLSHVASSLDDVKHFWEDNELSATNLLDQSGNSAPDSARIDKRSGRDRVFVIHGRDNEAKQTIARFLEKIDLKPVILHEQPDGGRTVIEKFENYADVEFAVVLLTPDDLGSLRGEESTLKSRARQNVIFELGYFIGRLGRERVCTLIHDDVEIPTDYAGVLFNRLDGDGGWKMKLITELKNAGFHVDANKAL